MVDDKGHTASANSGLTILEAPKPPQPHTQALCSINFETDKKRPVEMIGTYSTFPEMKWAVIAQRSLDQAQIDTGVTELNRQALAFVSVVVLVAILVGYVFALGISGPIRGLAASTRAISRGEFHQRSAVRGASEISELAETFNHMAGDIEEFVVQLRQAADQNHELFLGSIRMLAAAIDEKDPYTRGHSGRVAKYSILIGQQLGGRPGHCDSAGLHDVAAMGQFEGHACVLLNEEHSNAVLIQTANHLEDCLRD